MAVVQAAKRYKADDTTLQKKVEALDWECETADTRYLTHGIHRYSGKFIPQVARQAIDLLTEPGELVLDPYCGSGTTLLEAYISNRRSIGIDMNPLAVLLARTKCSPISSSRIDRLVKILRASVAEIQNGDDECTLFALQASEAVLAIRHDPRICDDWYQKWFPRKALFQLVGIHRAIMRIDEEDIRNLALMAFSDILRRCSYAHSGYPNVMYDKRLLDRPDPSPLFLDRLSEFAAAVSELAGCGKLGEAPDVREGDARATGLPSDHMDAVITHPPYIGSIPYAEYGALSLTWLGHDAKALDLRLTGGKRQARNVIERFRDDYSAMLAESFRVLKPGRHLFVLVGHPLVKGERVDLADMTTQLAAKAGFTLKARVARTGMNHRANKMGDEKLLFYQKPRS